MKIPETMPWLGEAERASVSDAIEESWITEGPRSAEFSRRLNSLFGADYGVFAPNGTLALYLGLAALGIQPGDEVLVPDTTFVGSANAVLLAGAIPVFVEVNRHNFQIDVECAEERLTSRTRAVMPVHLYGMAADMNRIVPFAERHGLMIIEDAAQAVGVRYQGRHAGTFGDVGCFSFFADKTITTGEGGYVVCREKSTFERLSLLRNQGRMERGSFVHQAVGYNLRITDLQAAVGLSQLDRLPEIIARKQKILEHYRDRLQGCPEIQFLEVEEGSDYVPFRMALLTSAASPLRESLRGAGVASRSFFCPLHRQPCFQDLGRGRGGPLNLDDEQYPNAVYAYEQGVCLPIFPTLEGSQIDYVCDRVRTFFYGR